MMFFCFQKGLEVAKVEAEDKDLNPFSYEFFPGLSCFVYFPFLLLFFGKLFLSKIYLMQSVKESLSTLLLTASNPDDKFMMNNLTGSISVNKNLTRGTYYLIAMVRR